jgi:hypothetical protein
LEAGWRQVGGRLEAGWGQVGAWLERGGGRLERVFGRPEVGLRLCCDESSSERGPPRIRGGGFGERLREFFSREGLTGGRVVGRRGLGRRGLAGGDLVSIGRFSMGPLVGSRSCELIRCVSTHRNKPTLDNSGKVRLDAPYLAWNPTRNIPPTRKSTVRKGCRISLLGRNQRLIDSGFVQTLKTTSGGCLKNRENLSGSGVEDETILLSEGCFLMSLGLI